MPNGNTGHPADVMLLPVVLGANISGKGVDDKPFRTRSTLHFQPI